MTTIRNFKIKPYFKWFDFWIGFYYDRTLQNLYIGYFPMFGIKIHRHYWVVPDHNDLRIFCAFCTEKRQGVLTYS